MPRVRSILGKFRVLTGRRVSFAALGSQQRWERRCLGGSGNHRSGLDGLGRLLSSGDLGRLGSLLGDGRGLSSSRRLLNLLGLLLSLFLGLLSLLAPDGSAELRERGRRLGLLALLIRSSLVLAQEGADKRKRALALVALDLLLGLTVGSRGSLDGLSRDSGRRRDLSGEGLGGLDCRDHGGSLSDGLGGGRGLLRSRSGLGGSNLLLAEGQVTEQALALGLGLRDGLLLLLLGLGLSGGLSSDRLCRGLSSGDLGGSFRSSFDSSGSLRLCGLGLSGVNLLLLLLAKEVSEDGGALAAGRATLGLFLLRLLLLSLLLLLGGLGDGSSLGGGSLSGRGGLGSRLDSGCLLLLLRGLELLKGSLVRLRFGDSGGKLLGLRNLGLQLGDPGITLGECGGLEGMLVALGGEVELVGALGDGVGSLSLFRSASASWSTAASRFAYQLDGALRGRLLLLAEEQQTLAGLRSPRSDVMRNIGNLVGLERANSLDINGIGAEPKELLGVNQVPLTALARCFPPVDTVTNLHVLGEVGTLALVRKLALLNGLHLLLLLGLLCGGGRLGGLGSSGGNLGLRCRGLGGSSRGRGCLLGGLRLDDGLGNGSGLNGLCVGHCECVEGSLGKLGIKNEAEKRNGYQGITEKESKKTEMALVRLGDH